MSLTAVEVKDEAPKRQARRKRKNRVTLKSILRRRNQIPICNLKRRKKPSPGRAHPEPKPPRRRESSSDDFLAKLSRLVEKWPCPQSLKEEIAETWLADWREKHALRNAGKTLGKGDQQPSEVTAGPGDSNLAETLVSYADDEVYVCFCFPFFWSSLPDRVLGAARADAVDQEVLLLMAANRTGRHRTRLCVIGKEWRPTCLRHVNMLSQPVVYAGGGDGRVTADLFAWWFYHEFSPGALTINRKVVLLAETKSRLPCDDFASEDARAKFHCVRTFESGERAAEDVIRTELRMRYAKLLLSNVKFDERDSSVFHYMSQYTLKDAFMMLHKAWLAIRVESFGRYFRRLLFETCSDPSLVGGFDEALEVDVQQRLRQELQWIALDLGLEIADDDMLAWEGTGFVASSMDDSLSGPNMTDKVKTEYEGDGGQEIPTADEAVAHLSKALLWMETEPLDPSLLLFLSNIILMAKQACWQTKFTDFFGKRCQAGRGE